MFPTAHRFELLTDFPPESRSPLEIVVIYDDRSSFHHAIDRLSASICDLGNANDVCLLPWRFSEIWCDPWRDRAQSDAADADILVVSADANVPMPQDVLDWIGGALERRGKRHGKIVMLRGHGVDGPYFEWSVSEVARRIADHAGLPICA